MDLKKHGHMQVKESGKNALVFANRHVIKRIKLKFSDGTSFGNAWLEIPQNISLGASELSAVLSKEIMDLASDLLAPSTYYDGMTFELIGSHDNNVLFRITFGGGHQQPSEITDEINNLGNYLVEIAVVDQTPVHEWEKEYQPLLKGPK